MGSQTDVEHLKKTNEREDQQDSTNIRLPHQRRRSRCRPLRSPFREQQGLHEPRKIHPKNNENGIHPKSVC